MAVRQATVQDVEAIIALEMACMGELAWSPKLITSTLVAATSDADGICVLALTDLGGYAVLRVVGPIADLDRIAVHPRCQRQGRARSLLVAVIQEARSAGADALMLEVAQANDAARSLYTACGFSQVARRAHYYGHGKDALVMRNLLDEAP